MCVYIYKYINNDFITRWGGGDKENIDPALLSKCVSTSINRLIMTLLQGGEGGIKKI